MELIVKTPGKLVDNNKPGKQKEDFLSEFARGYLEVENMKERELLREYEEAYSDLDDKNTFHAQYLKSLIENLKY